MEAYNQEGGMLSLKIPLMAGIKIGWISGQNFLKNSSGNPSGPEHFPFGIDWMQPKPPQV